MVFRSSLPGPASDPELSILRPGRIVTMPDACGLVHAKERAKRGQPRRARLCHQFLRQHLVGSRQRLFDHIACVVVQKVDSPQETAIPIEHSHRVTLPPPSPPADHAKGASGRDQRWIEMQILRRPSVGAVLAGLTHVLAPVPSTARLCASACWRRRTRTTKVRRSSPSPRYADAQVVQLGFVPASRSIRIRPFAHAMGG